MTSASVLLVLAAVLGTWILPVCLTLAVPAALLGQRLHGARQWERELEAAFRVHERRELNLNRVL